MALLAANWKMNGTCRSVRQLAEGMREKMAVDERLELLVLPAMVHLSLLQQLWRDTSFHWGAQHVSAYADGAFTGEVSVAMLQDLGCSAVLLGHSERRQLFGVTDQYVAKQLQALANSTIRPIVCVGEPLAQYQQGSAIEYVSQQLDAVIPWCVEQQRPVVIAYEPIWAIGSGLVASTDDVSHMHEFIRKKLDKALGLLANECKILYGGSVKPANAPGLIKLPLVDGFLVGGASLELDSIVTLGELCNKYC